MTLEIPIELSEQIERAAIRSGTDVQTFVLNATRAAIENAPQDDAAQKRREVAAAGLGMFAGRGRTVDEFLAERHAEGEAEYEKWIEGQKAK